MAKFGYTLYCEGNKPRSLVEQAVLAEDAGFDFLVISDHYHPWVTNQSHAGFAWSILGAIAQVTNNIELATMVTCPIMRYHPAIVAQAAATVGVLSGGRFTLGLGAGERLNEHVVGQGWPNVSVRQKMLKEAIEIIDKLFEGGYQTYDGKYFQLDDARLFDLPPKTIEMFMGISGPSSASLAAKMNIGVCVTEPEEDVVSNYISQKGSPEHVWGQVVLSWDKTVTAGLQTAWEQFRFAATGWKVQSELPNPVNFDAATEKVEPEDLKESIPAGPDAKRHLLGITNYLDAGVKNLAVAYPGTDVKGFMKFWKNELKPQLVK